jgi:curved DNA-binding protein CbpA
MGQSQSIPKAHIDMYKNVLQIKSPGQRVQMINTILLSPEHKESAQRAGIYGHLLHFISSVNSGAQSRLPGEDSTVIQSQPQVRQNQVVHYQQAPQQPKSIIAKPQSNEKAMNYFSACLRILGLEEEVALTEEILKGAYKKAVIRAHPDKQGGSEEEFQAVTKAYAYLGEILKRIHGGRSKEGVMEAPNTLQNTRSNEADKWKHVEPVALNPKKLNMQDFNKMFDQTRIPDPDETGYGDWLKGNDSVTNGPQFSGKFNREVFHKVFEEDAKSKGKTNMPNSLMVQEMSLASRMGATELGRGAKEDYTIAPHEGKMAYTDLKKAYTEYNTFSHETANVTYEDRSFDQMSKARKDAPPPLTDFEMQALQAAERQAEATEQQRKLRMAQQAIEEQEYFERMKRFVIRNN